MKNSVKARLFIIVPIFSHSFINTMLSSALKRSVKTAPKITHSPFLPQRAIPVQTQKPLFTSEFTAQNYGRPIKPTRPSTAPPIVQKSFWGYLLALLGLDILATSDDKDAQEEALFTNLLELAETRDPQAVAKISQFFISASTPLKQKFFDLLIKTTPGYDVLIKTLNNSPEIAPIITSLISEQNISHIYTTHDGRNLIAKIIEKNQQALHQFAYLAENQLSPLCTSISGSHFVSNMITLQPTIAPAIISQMVQSDSIDSLRVFNTAVKRSPYNKITADYIKNRYNPDNLESILTVLIFNHAQDNPSHTIDIPTPTKSLLHISANIEDIANSSWIDTMVKTPEITQLATQALAQEHNISSKNSGYIFYHGQSREYGFLQELYAALYQTKYGTAPTSDFIFTNLHKPATDDQSLQEENIRKQLIHNDPADRWKKNIPGHRLFMTAALLGNSGESDLSPLAYVMKNKGTNEVKISPADIFAMFGYQDLYKEVKNDVEQLYQEHKALSPFGQLLQIVVPQSKIAEYVYSAGNKGENEPVMVVNGDKKEVTFDIQKIMQAFPNNIPNSDNKEFVLANVATRNGPLDPSGPFKIFSHDSVSADKKQNYDQKKAVLFSSIKERIGR